MLASAVLPLRCAPIWKASSYEPEPTGRGKEKAEGAQSEGVAATESTSLYRVCAYQKETVIADMCQALVNLGMTNTRIRDFYDLWYLSRTYD